MKIYTFLIPALLLTGGLTAQTDTVPPQLVCKQLGQINYTYLGGPISYWATDFIDTVYDNVTPGAALELGIRKRCTGDGFPENKIAVSYNPEEIFAPCHIELWARDAAGNTATCYSTFTLNSNSPTLDFGHSMVIRTPADAGIDSAFVHIEGHNCLQDSIYPQDFNLPTYNGGWGAFGTIITFPGFSTTLTPYKTIHPLNGVTTLDLALISKHILNVQPFTDPYQIIAADANQDGYVTVSDIVVLKKLIQGITTTLPNNKSWRFLPGGYQFPDPQYPLQTPFPEQITVPPTADPVPWGYWFTGIKIGDVNGSADPKH